ncbi:6-phosphofructo-2-kinase-domain-containing protein [Polychytrium aggregatum]|uniref:6-phosphofructo-2-kinase-domain-containing protein n=1 Tax=Polychytrium aggregatum TaxID=110093 RepID=UPI0022FDF859|nr:6-phosphofructo-2-kinase-domain-containing protein [Polychytrium aggregatum]KAI9209890.1 6-phosphofructo-2-kinase-domain-containing protein [Polychytrium aggregatum]
MVSISIDGGRAACLCPSICSNLGSNLGGGISIIAIASTSPFAASRPIRITLGINIFRSRLCQVGLPARGKSYISKKLCRYLVWCGFRTQIFNVGNRRRAIPISPSVVVTAPNSTTHDAKFFDPHNSEAKAIRDQLATDTLEELIAWLKKGGKVGIHDATNSTKERRAMLLERVAQEKSIRCIFVESICTEGEVLDQNIRMKLRGPDYLNMDSELAIQDFCKRIRNYEVGYETISQEEEDNGMGYIKIINVGKKVIAHNIKGYLASHCVLYLMQMHIKQRTIWISRHGESEYNTEHRIGGDPPLTARGRQYASALAQFIQNSHPPIETQDSITSLDENFGTDAHGCLSVWTSTLRRTIETGDYFDQSACDIKHIKTLNEINAGIFESMTYEEIERRYPREYQERQFNKLNYRYPGPGGESYMDVIDRLRPIVIELERMETNVAIITHHVVTRTLLGYFTGIPLQNMPTLEVPLHVVYCLKPQPYGTELIKYVCDHRQLCLWSRRHLARHGLNGCQCFVHCCRRLLEWPGFCETAWTLQHRLLRSPTTDLCNIFPVGHRYKYDHDTDSFSVIE